jgi:hypothetical protein
MTDLLPGFIDRDWVAAALDRSGISGGATLAGIDFVGWIGTGQMARNGRIVLSWDESENRPASAVVKVPSADREVAAFAFATGGYLTELQFYRDVAPTVGCRVPACYRTEYRPDDLEFALLMEDIVGAEPGDQFAGLRPEQLDATIAQAARLHAPRYGDPSLAARAPGRDAAAAGDDFAEFAEMAYSAALEPMIDRLGHGLHDDVIGIFEAVRPHVATWARGGGAPETLIHGDLRGDNLLFRGDAASPEVVVVDWQTVRPGSAGADVAYLVSGSIADPAERAECEAQLVASYLGAMATLGVDIDSRTFWQEYRLGSIWGLLITAVATMQATRTQRGEELFTIMAMRHGTQALHLDPLGLLP